MRRPLACMAVWVALGVLSMLAVPRIAVEGLPSLRVPVLRVITLYPQTPPEAVEREITIPLENALSSVAGITRIESVAKLGVTRTTLHLRPGSSSYRAAFRVREQIDALYPGFPHGAAKPIVLSSELSRRPAAVLAVLPQGELSFTELSSITRDQLLPLLAAMPQFAQVRLRAYRESELHIRLIDRLLAAAEFGPEQIADRVNGALRPYAPGSIEQDGRRHMVRIVPEADSPEALAALPMQAALELGQIAAVEIGETALDEFFLVDAQPGLGIELYAAPGVGEIRAVAALMSELPALEQRFTGRLQLRVVDEAGSALSAALVSVAVALCIGVVVAFVVLLPSFRRPALAMLPAAALPATLVAVLPLLEALGVSINLITLSGFVVGLGMVFDNAIMVTDRLISLPGFCPESGAEAVAELGAGLFAATATTMIVLLPVLALPGTLGLLFGEAALVMLLLPPASLLAAVTLVPALYVLLLRDRATVPGVPPVLALSTPPVLPLSTPPVLAQLPPRFRPPACLAALDLPRPGRVHGVVILLLSALCLAVVITHIPRETLPQSPGLGYELQIRFPAGTGVELTSSRLQRLYRQFILNPELEPLYARGGVGSKDTEARSGTVEAAATARLLFQARSDVDLGELERSVRRSFPEAFIEVRPRPDQAAAALSSPGEHAAFIQAQTRSELAGFASYFGSLGFTQSGLAGGSPGIELSLQAAALSNSGSSPAPVLGALQFIGEGRHIADIRLNGRERPVRLFLEPASLLGGLEAPPAVVDRVRLLELFLPSGPRSLNLLGTLETVESADALYRSNRQPALPVPQSVIQELEQREAPAGTVLFVPEREHSARSAGEIGVVAAAAVLLILLLLSAVFESPRQAVLVLGSTLPCAAAALSAVWLAGGSLNLGVGLGLIMLFGNAVNTTILPAALLQSGGGYRSPADAVRELGRGILFSTLSTAAALLPALVAGLRFPGMHSYTALPLFAGLLFGTPLSLLVFLALSRQSSPTTSYVRTPGACT